MSENKDLTDWYNRRGEDYAAVKGRLQSVRSDLLHGSVQEAAKALERSYLFAVLSIKTERERHENAFVGHYTGNLSRKEAALETVYGGNKKSWIRKTFNQVDWEDLAIAVRTHVLDGNYAQLLDIVNDKLTGVAYRKGAFMLAMLGVYEYMCIDSNVARYAGLEESKGNSLDFKDGKEYMKVCSDIHQSTDIPEAPFIVQWAIYDLERGEHARHQVFYNELEDL